MNQKTIFNRLLSRLESTPPEILEQLSTDPDEEIRMNVVKNPSTTLLTIHKMLQAELTAIGQKPA